MSVKQALKRNLEQGSVQALITIGLCLTAGLAMAQEGGQLGRTGRWQKSTQDSPDLSATAKRAKAEPENADAQNDYGWALRQNNEPVKAQTFLQKAEQLNPSLAYVHSNLGVVYLELGKTEDALAEAKQAITLDDKQPIYHVVLGNALLANTKTKDAISEYNKAIELRPDYENAYYNLGKALKDDGQHNEAIAALNKALQLDPEDYRVLELMDETKHRFQ